MPSATAGHAIRALLVLARTSGRRYMHADEIAAATGAPQNYMAKTLNALARARIVSSARGPAGGFALAVEPESLTLARVVDLFAAPRPQSRCMLGNTLCNPERPCAAHECWTAVMNARRAPLIATTIADLLADYPDPRHQGDRHSRDDREDSPHRRQRRVHHLDIRWLGPRRVHPRP